MTFMINVGAVGTVEVRGNGMLFVVKRVSENDVDVWGVGRGRYCFVDNDVNVDIMANNDTGVVECESCLSEDNNDNKYCADGWPG